MIAAVNQLPAAAANGQKVRDEGDPESAVFFFPQPFPFKVAASSFLLSVLYCVGGSHIYTHTVYQVTMARWADHTLFARKRLALLFTFVLLFLTLVIYNSSCVFDSIPTSLDHNVEQQPATEQLTSIATPEDLAANSTLGVNEFFH